MAEWAGFPYDVVSRATQTTGRSAEVAFATSLASDDVLHQDRKVWLDSGLNHIFADDSYAINRF